MNWLLLRSLQLSSNPFRGPLGLRFAMPAAAAAEALIFDAGGHLVRRIDGGVGREAPPGVYFIRVRAGAYEQRAKAVRRR